MRCGWEGNRRSGVALAMHHRRDEHPAYAHLWSVAPFTFILPALDMASMIIAYVVVAVVAVGM